MVWVCSGGEYDVTENNGGVVDIDGDFDVGGEQLWCGLAVMEIMMWVKYNESVGGKWWRI